MSALPNPSQPNRPGIVDGIVVKAKTVYAPGWVKWAEPCGMRPADLRLAGDRIGEYHLSNGRVVWATWKPCKGPTYKTHSDIWLWDAGDYLGVIRNVGRLQAAKSTEKVLRQLEAV